MASNFNVIPIRWLLTVDSEMALLLFHSLAEGVLVFFQNSCSSRKIHCQTGEFQSKFHSKNQYRTHRLVIHAISVLINNDLDKHILAKTNDKSVRRLGDILAPLSRETKLNMRSQDKLRVQSH